MKSESITSFFDSFSLASKRHSEAKPKFARCHKTDASLALSMMWGDFLPYRNYKNARHRLTHLGRIVESVIHQLYAPQKDEKAPVHPHLFLPPVPGEDEEGGPQGIK
jgi:hypothetical protein